MAMLANPLPQLTDDPTGTALGLALPPGRLIGPAAEPLLWYADEPAGPEDWAHLAPARRASGLHPVLLGGIQELADWGWPRARPRTRATTTPRTCWPSTGRRMPRRSWATTPRSGPAWRRLRAQGEPGPQSRRDRRGGDRRGPPEGRPDRPGPGPPKRDIPAAVGWRGALNHELDVAGLCAVLRWWEDRLGCGWWACTLNSLDGVGRGPAHHRGRGPGAGGRALRVLPGHDRDGPAPSTPTPCRTSGVGPPVGLTRGGTEGSARAGPRSAL